MFVIAEELGFQGKPNRASSDAGLADERTVSSRSLESLVQLGQDCTIHARSIWTIRSSGIGVDMALERVLAEDDKELAAPM